MGYNDGRQRGPRQFASPTTSVGRPVTELEELRERLAAFSRAHTGDIEAAVSGVEVMPGHAGFSYGFTIDYQWHGAPRSESFVLRLPPPNVRFQGPADVLRQARVMSVLRDSPVPVPPVRWSGDDPRWFGRPYFITERLPGQTLRVTEEGPGISPDAAALRRMAAQAVDVLMALHRIDWQEVIAEWGPPLEPQVDVVRWDRFWERAADPELVKQAPQIRRRLLARLPGRPRIGIFHGDFQWSNFLYEGERLVAVLDWELAGIGPTLNDLGWLMLFSDPDSWAHEGRVDLPLPSPEEIESMYREALDQDPGDVAWYRALAGYKFAIIGGFNLTLHRRGKRLDPHWEDLVPSIPRLLERAGEVLE